MRFIFAHDLFATYKRQPRLPLLIFEKMLAYADLNMLLLSQGVKMADIKKEFSNSGKITCNKNILLSIISLATKEISGVASLSNKFKNPISKLFTKKSFDGVRAEFNNEGQLIVDVYINVFNGYSIPEVSYRVQENIKNNIASMVDMKASKVNVHVVDVEIPKDDN